MCVLFTRHRGAARQLASFWTFTACWTHTLNVVSNSLLLLTPERRISNTPTHTQTAKRTAQVLCNDFLLALLVPLESASCEAPHSNSTSEDESSGCKSPRLSLRVKSAADTKVGTNTGYEENGYGVHLFLHLRLQQCPLVAKGGGHVGVIWAEDLFENLHGQRAQRLSFGVFTLLCGDHIRRLRPVHQYFYIVDSLLATEERQNNGKQAVHLQYRTFCRREFAGGRESSGCPASTFQPTTKNLI